MSEASPIHLFGIRHHGPGSARSLLQALERTAPDMILIEGPPEGESLLPLAMHEAMETPVSMLVYVPDQPRRAAFFPFAEFSPEWQAIRFALARDVPVRFIDLPQTHQLALADEAAETETDDDTDDGSSGRKEMDEGEDIEEEGKAEIDRMRTDPIGWLAAAAGFSDGERWWEQMVEHRTDGEDLFGAINEAMTALREAEKSSEPEEDRREALREAWMRRRIRAAVKEGFQRIAVVCGAWHVPALAKLPAIKHDNELLKGLPRIKVACTWAPWTYGRLTRVYGYGAGIASPGWYDHLWRNGAKSDSSAITIGWLTRVARLLREEDLDASSAHVIEAVRLAETLAALGERSLPGLPDLDDAARTVFTQGDETPMRIIHDRLIVGDRLGSVPPDTPTMPLVRRPRTSAKEPATQTAGVREGSGSGFA